MYHGGKEQRPLIETSAFLWNSESAGQIPAKWKIKNESTKYQDFKTIQDRHCVKTKADGKSQFYFTSFITPYSSHISTFMQRKMQSFETTQSFQSCFVVSQSSSCYSQASCACRLLKCCFSETLTWLLARASLHC